MYICMFSTEALELVYMKDEGGAVYQVVPFHDKLLVSVNSEVRGLDPSIISLSNPISNTPRI